MIWTVDPEARHAHKSVERRQDGFKAHVVIEPDTGLATAVALTKAAGPAASEANVGIGLLATDPTIDGAPVQVLGDSAYGTGDMLAALDATGLIPVISRGRCAPPCRAGSPSTTSSTTPRSPR